MLPLTTETILQEIFPEQDTTPEEMSGALAVLRWINDNTRCYLIPEETSTFNTIVLESIHDAVEKILNVDPKLIYTSSRKRKVVYARARAFREYQTLTGSTLSETTNAFRSSSVHCHPILNSDCHRKVNS